MLMTESVEMSDKDQLEKRDDRRSRLGEEFCQSLRYGLEVRRRTLLERSREIERMKSKGPLAQGGGLEEHDPGMPSSVAWGCCSAA